MDEYDLEAELDANDEVLKKHNKKQKVTAKEKADAETQAEIDAAT